MQETFDTLYKKSKNNGKFKNLVELITKEENILLAYREIKNNKGIITCGTNGRNIEYLKNMKKDKLINLAREKIKNYKPDKVRRVEIPKPNGEKRPLGIPTIEDRLIQQCIKQILEPICEAKFHPHSYGFRPNRSTEHAIGRMLFLTNLKDYHYLVDVDLKGFFDNVSHSKLKKQLWSMGIQDKNLLCIIGKMLKAEIENVGIPEKGTPQGGILSPLLSNIVLNELDWWISNQYETMKFKKKNGDIIGPRQTSKIKSECQMKKIFIVRYADDFKLICKSYDEAKRINIATQKWLKERLNLKVNEKKTKIINLKKNYSEFLGFKFKIWKKGNKHVTKSNMSDKAKEEVKRKLKKRIKWLQEKADSEHAIKYNACLLGTHGYYNKATNVSKDFREIGFSINRTLYNRLRKHFSKTGIKSKAYEKYYSKYSGNTLNVLNVRLFPVTYIKTKNPMCFNQEINNYTEEGRSKVHEKLKEITNEELIAVMNTSNGNNSTELNDNRISLYIAQKGMCKISGQKLSTENMEVHHKKPKEQDGTDDYKNLVIIHKYMHKLIHVKDETKILKYMSEFEWDKQVLKKLNELRNKVGNVKIELAI